MKNIFLFLISVVTLYANIGTVVDSVGESKLLRAGKELKVRKKLELIEHDTIKTGRDSKVKIFFKDNTVVSLGENTSFSIDSYFFEDNNKKSNVKFKVLRGFFKTVTGKIGKIAPNRFKLQTKNATIGIRGTVFAAEVGDDADVVICTDGRIILFTKNGDIVVDKGKIAKARENKKVEIKNYTLKEKLEIIKKAGWRGSMSIDELRAFIKKNFKEPLRSQLLEALENILLKDSDSRNKEKKTKIVNADDIGYVDDITINNREFDELPREIEFYPEDLKDGKVIVQGILESDDKNIPVSDLKVEISTDGGESWSRANGNGEWEWSFEPELEKRYALSIRVVREIKDNAGDNESNYNESEEPNDVNINFSQTFMIAGFKLYLDANVAVTDGKITGSGILEIPYLDKISSLPNKLNVNFQNLSFSGNNITLGDIEYTNSFTINTPLADINIDKIVISATPSHNKIEGEVVFKDELGVTFDNLVLPEGSKFSSNGFSIEIPFSEKTINIWREKGVSIYIPSGSFKLSYNLGDALPKADFDIPSAQFKMGELLTYANGVEAGFGIMDFGKTPSISLPNDVYLLDTGIKIPSGLNLSFDLNDFSDPKMSFSSSVDLSGYDNSFVKGLSNVQIEATVQKSGFHATISGEGGFEPITLIDRGSDEKSVRLIFDGENPSFDIDISNGNAPSFAIKSVEPKISFGDLFSDSSKQALNLVASLGSLEAPTLNISDTLYLLGSNIKLPNGFSAGVDLSDIKNPVLTFDVNVDLSGYDNLIAKHINNAKLKGTLSKSGFSGSVRVDSISPIDIYSPKDVKIIFNGGVSFDIDISSLSTVPDFSISDLDAKLNFGTLFSEVASKAQNIEATLATLDSSDILELALPAKVRLLKSNLILDGMSSTLDLRNRKISLNSSVDLSEYSDNPLISALSGTSFSMTLSTSGFEGKIQVEDQLEPIDILPSKGVVLNISGKPSIDIKLNSDGVDFSFSDLSASIDFGDLLKNAQGQSVEAILSEIENRIGEYSVTLKDKVYLLGSNFALDKPQIDFNPNVKSLKIESVVDLSSYTEPMIKVFDGASFSATLSKEGFSGTLTKEGSLDPIVLLKRGGEGKDISLQFSSSPVISVEIKNSGVGFGISGGNMKINFGDFLGGAVANLNAVKKGVYDWALDSRAKLISGAKAYVEHITNASLDINDIKDPKISFNATIDLSEYGGFLSSVTNAELKDVIISKEGFSAKLSARIEDIDIWQEKRVTMSFLSEPTLSLRVDKGGLDIGVSDLSARINFGDLLNGATADIGDVLQSGKKLASDIGSATKSVKEGVKEEIKESLGSEDFSWSINGTDIQLMDSDILLKEIGGSLDLSDLSNPKITLNALADLSNYGTLFQYVRSAEISDATISKDGFEGSLITTLQDINIYREKNVKLHFNKAPKLYLKVKTDGVKIGASDIDATLYFGDLLNNAVASLSALEEDIYSWSVEGKNRLADTSIYLSNFVGKMDFSNLKDPIIEIDSATFEGLSEQFKNITLKSAKISRKGFDAYIYAGMDDINLYTEDTRKIDLRFKDSKTPTLHLKLETGGVDIGFSDFQASLVFTNMLNNSIIDLNSLVNDGIKVEGVYTWGLSGEYQFLNDSNGVITVRDIGGSLDLTNWRDPVATFHTVADFTNYNFSDNLNLGIADVERAEIKKDKIEWNVSLQNARANFTILDLGDGPNDDVRVELKNISASASSSGVGSVSAGDGTLYMGKLFDGNKRATLRYNTDNGGLKTYGFSFSEDLVYKSDDDNYITLKSPSGELIEVSNGVYKVVLNSDVEVHSSLLSAINIGTLTASDLEISSSGFKGSLDATFNDTSYSLLSDKVTLELTKVGFDIDTSKSMPISLKTFDGNLDLGGIFDEESAKAALSLATSGMNSLPELNWNFPASTNLHLNRKFIFKNLKGSLNLGSLDTASINISGNFNIDGVDEDITLNNFKISASGVEGSISWSGNKSLVNNKLFLKDIGITFAGINTSGSIKINYNDSSFLGTGNSLNIMLSAVVDKDGIDSFKFAMNNPKTINVAGFANFEFNSVSASPNFSDFWISLDGTVKPNNSLFNADTSMSFTGLKISKNGISVNSANANLPISGASASLGSLTLSINSLGIGFDGNKNLFFIKANGGIALDIIGNADAGVTLYSDKSISVNDISVDIRQSAFSAKGSLSWYDNDQIYGNGFKATVGVSIAELFSGNGLFRIGNKGELFYWMVKASGGLGAGGIPLSPIPLSIYEIGGGVAYHMKYSESNGDFIPDSRSNALILTTVLGTSGDSGYLWNGDIDITATLSDGTLSQLRLDGMSWILATRSEKPSKRRIEAHMTLSKSAFHLWISANVEYHGIKVNGKMDSMFSSSEKHVFIGSDTAYAYAFAGYTELGHVNVTAFGISGYGFFMVDSNAIAFGEGIKLNKHWSKSWVGPDPSLDFKLNAGAKALFIYDPFQMNIDVFAEVGLKACYGGCLTVGADVLVKLATPNPYYIWGKAGVKIMGKHISFSGCIDGDCSNLQESSPKPDFIIFDRAEIPMSGDGASLLPYIKIVSKIPKAQNLVDIKVDEIVLAKESSSGIFNSFIPLECGVLDGDFKGVACMPIRKLDKHREYRLVGKMVATYEEAGKTESTEKTFVKTFRTTSENIISFDEIVKRITPADKDENVHEDSGVVIEYNQKVVSKLGINSDLIKDYEIELYDSDNNRIGGSFTPPNANYKAKFKPNRDLRVYRYCKNEEGKIRETFVLNGEYLNPFNDFKVDNGDSNIPVASEVLSASNVSQTVPTEQSLSDMQKILNAVAETSANGSGNNNTQGGSVNTALIQNANLTPNQMELAKAIPPDLRLGDITLNDPQALGEFVKSSYNSGKSYSYYRASKYKIVVRHKPTNKIVHNSTFRIRYNNIPAEAKRKVEQMGGTLDPSLTVRFDVNRLGGGDGVYMVNRDELENSYNDGFYNEVRLRADDGLLDIGVTSSIITRVTAIFTIQTRKGGTKEIKKSWINDGQEMDFFLPGIVTEYSGIIEYFTDNMGQPGDKLLEKELRLISGEPFNAEAEREAQEAAQEAKEEAKNSAQKAGERVDVLGAGDNPANNGFGQVGGGFNPMDEVGAFENMDVSVRGGAAMQNGAGVGGGAGAHIIVDVGR